MTSELQFPIVLRAKRRNVLIALAVGALLLAGGVGESMDDDMTRVPFFGWVPMHYVGWLTFAIGLLVFFAALQSLLRGRPLVLIEADRVVFLPNFGAARRVAWSDVDRWNTYANRYGGGVAIHTMSGKKIWVPAVDGTADDLFFMLKRAAKADAQKPKGPASPARPPETT